ncbi:YcnI family protein [Actinomadura sp. HBU206391]|uniref:YcnI family protein n=1 Tax=Actinomadura sp. HBU206391 TaxID=2731692 RepID=UPI001C9D3EDB|nr:YcnI family protein [Actinomadura sp. HBU206391]
MTVAPDTATQGAYAALIFRVPNERDDANTVKVDVQLPPELPVASVRVKPHPGWSYELKKTKPATPIEAHGAKVTEAVSEIIWTATDPKAGIRPDEYDEFAVSAGPLPKADAMVFKTLQHYSDGEVVRWIQEPQSGGAEPERPAPVLKLLPPSQAGAGRPVSLPIGNSGDDARSDAGSPAAHWAMGLSGAALVIALGCAAMVIRRSRQ